MTALTREELWDKYGKPLMVSESGYELVAFLHESQEAAEAYALANREHYGYPAWTEEVDGRWHSVVDLRPAIAEITKKYKESLRSKLIKELDRLERKLEHTKAGIKSAEVELNDLREDKKLYETQIAELNEMLNE
jgi:hypothetical protein